MLPIFVFGTTRLYYLIIFLRTRVNHWYISFSCRPQIEKQSRTTQPIFTKLLHAQLQVYFYNISKFYIDWIHTFWNLQATKFCPYAYMISDSNSSTILRSLVSTARFFSISVSFHFNLIPYKVGNILLFL